MAHEHEEVRVRRLQHGLSAWTADPPVIAAWNDVPQPGRRRARSVRQAASVGTARSHSGCANVASRVASPCHEGVYSISGVDGYSFVHAETARFRDLDPMGHVNNAVYLTWMENARIEFLRSLGAFDEVDASGMTMILARAEVDFRSPVTFDERVDVGVRASASARRASTSSTSPRRRARGRGEDRARRIRLRNLEPKEIPTEWRQRLAA